MTSITPAQLRPDVQNFEVSGTWTRPAWATDDHVMLVEGWGGGGGGAGYGGGNEATGGGGGAYAAALVRVGDFGATEPVEVGAGGAGGLGVGDNGANGGNSRFSDRSKASFLFVRGSHGIANTGGADGGQGTSFLPSGSQHDRVAVSVPIGENGQRSATGSDGGNGVRCAGGNGARNGSSYRSPGTSLYNEDGFPVNDAGRGSDGIGYGQGGGAGATGGGDGADGFIKITVYP